MVGRSLAPTLLGATLLATALAAGQARAESQPIPEDPRANDRFGAALAIDGDHLLVGAPGDNDGAFNGGALSLYTRDGDALEIAPKIYADEYRGQEWYGQVIAHDEGVLLVGGYAEDFSDPYTPPRRRTALIFRRSGDQWSQEARLELGDPEVLSDRYGAAVAIAGDRAAIAADLIQVGDAYTSPRIDLFERRGGAWERDATIVSDAGNTGIRGLALVGDHLVVAASTTRAYTVEGGAWTEATLPPEITRSDAVVTLPGSPPRIAIADLATLHVLRHEGAWTLEATLALPDRIEYSPQPLSAAPGQLVALTSVTTDTGDAALDVVTFREEGGIWAPFGSPVRVMRTYTSRPALSADLEHLYVGLPFAVADDGLHELGAVEVYRASADGWSRVETLSPHPDVAPSGGCRIDAETPGRRPSGPLALLLLALPLLARSRSTRR